MQQIVQGFAAADVHVEVDATIMEEEEVAKDVAALNRLFVGCVVFSELGILGSNPLGGALICPKPVLLAFLAFVHLYACFACCVVHLDVFVLLEPDVMQNLRNQ